MVVRLAPFVRGCLCVQRMCVESAKDGWVRARIAGLKAKKGQVIIAEDADQKEALPVENKDGWKQRIVRSNLRGYRPFSLFAGWMIRKCSAQKRTTQTPRTAV